ncbi:hypothetical protein V1478_015868 [Vespula squamosa]|uniref:Uncharacterized protein n=1 Tax=Vespula squamosa TaxID=30214 RepID=A0ABD2A254_VESSQ
MFKIQCEKRDRYLDGRDGWNGQLAHEETRRSDSDSLGMHTPKTNSKEEEEEEEEEALEDIPAGSWGSLSQGAFNKDTI